MRVQEGQNYLRKTRMSEVSEAFSTTIIVNFITPTSSTIEKMKSIFFFVTNRNSALNIEVD